jgi:hypothetical protein
MVDSLGSMHSNHDELRALETCAIKASYVKDATGFVTKNKARAQVVIINALLFLNRCFRIGSENNFQILIGRWIG